MSPHQLKTAKFLQPKHLHQARRTSTLDQEAEDQEPQDQEEDNNHPTQGEEEDKDGNKKAPQGGHNPPNL